VGGVLYFAATGPGAGREVWKIVQPDAPATLHVTGPYLFYNNSAYDGHDEAPTAADDAAVPTDKRSLLPGQSPTLANVSSYSRGLNGIMLDVTPGLPLAAFRPGSGAVELKAGNGGDPSAWPDAPYPSRYEIRPGAGAGGSDRITFVWPDGAIENTWLRVTIRAMPQYGLMQDEVFTFGHLAGETGDDGRVNALDLGQVKRLLNTAAPIDSRVDFNRDGRVNALDLGIAKKYLNRTLAPVVLPPPLVPAAPAASPEQLSVRHVWDELQWDLL